MIVHHQIARNGALGNAGDEQLVRGDGEAGCPTAAKPCPRICNSPPAMLARGVICSITGLPFIERRCNRLVMMLPMR
jgi:hypothetical protein